MKIHTIEPLKALASLFRYCQDNKLSISLAESVTGGRLSAAFTALPGSSRIFKEAVVCYSPESKKTRLNIQSEIIEKFGLVSSEITLLMARQVRKTLKTDIGVATTGNAGPEANDVYADVGQAFIAISTKKKHIIFPRLYRGTRNQIQNSITQDAIRSLYFVLLEGSL